MLKLQESLREHRLWLSSIVLGTSIVIFGLALGQFTSLKTDYPFSVINRFTDQTRSGGQNWDLLFAIFWPIPFAVGMYFVSAYLVARRRFELLISSESDAEFLRNVPELERLLSELTPAHEERFRRKYSELHTHP